MISLLENFEKNFFPNEEYEWTKNQAKTENIKFIQATALIVNTFPKFGFVWRHVEAARGFRNLKRDFRDIFEGKIDL